MLQYKHYGTIDQLYMYKFLFLLFIVRVWIQEKGRTINLKPWRVGKNFLKCSREKNVFPSTQRMLSIPYWSQGKAFFPHTFWFPNIVSKCLYFNLPYIKLLIYGKEIGHYIPSYISINSVYIIISLAYKYSGITFYVIQSCRELTKITTILSFL